MTPPLAPRMPNWNCGTASPGFTPTPQTNLDCYILELSDTNLVDHQTCDLATSFGLTFLLEGPFP